MSLGLRGRSTWAGGSSNGSAVLVRTKKTISAGSCDLEGISEGEGPKEARRASWKK